MRLSPSKLSKYLTCPQAYEYKYVQELEEESGQAAINGTAIHSALEYFYKEAEVRNLASALVAFDAVLETWTEPLAPEPDKCRELIWNLFDIEDPTEVNCLRTEMDLELPWGDHSLKGIIDRVDLEADGYVIVDYKSGKAPSDDDLNEKALGIKFYAMMGEKAFGKPPVRVKLLYLGTPQAITFDVGPAMLRSVERKATNAVEAIERGNFKAKPGLPCRWCSFKEICPSALTIGKRKPKVKP